MNLQQVMQPKSTSNGLGRRRGERDGATRLENKLSSGKPNPAKVTSTEAAVGSTFGAYESPSQDQLWFVTTCLIGHPVEVHVKNGSVYSGIFHATNGEKEFGIILKMARLIKDGTLQGQKVMTEFVSKAPSKTLIIPGHELVQIIAKEVAVTRDGLSNELPHDKQQEIMIDSFISQSRHAEAERELEPWVPDEDAPQLPELENIFDGSWNGRDWDQFATNETLFGVKSTFNEELYTTKLLKGPQTRELERQAMRIAREIEGEETRDLHLAEERGINLHENFDIDEETRFSSVYRGSVLDDSGYEEEEDIMLDSRNTETFGDSSSPVSNRPADLIGGKSSDEGQLSSCSSAVDEAQSLRSSASADVHHSFSSDHNRQMASEILIKGVSILDGESRVPENLPGVLGGNNDAKESVEKQQLPVDAQSSKSGDSQSSSNAKTNGSDKAGLSANATAYAPSHVSSKDDQKTAAPGEQSEAPVSGKASGETHSAQSRGRPGSSTSSGSENANAAPASSVPALSPSSSMGSLSSEKSSLNPYAKEFRLNPNAKSFVPSQASARPVSPVSDGGFYHPPASALQHMHGLPMGFGIGPSFPGHQPVMYNPQVGQMQSTQAYYHPHGPQQYGQQMLVGQPRQVYYMPNYQSEMPYKGREY